MVTQPRIEHIASRAEPPAYLLDSGRPVDLCGQLGAAIRREYRRMQEARDAERACPEDSACKLLGCCHRAMARQHRYALLLLLDIKNGEVA